MTARFVLESPVAGVVDWVPVMIPPEVISELGEQLVFVVKGSRMPVVLHGDPTRAGQPARVLCSFAEPIVHGEFESTDDPLRFAWQAHASVVEPKLPVIGPGWELASTRVVEESAAERVVRFAYVHGVDTIVIWRRTRALHPVVDYGVRWTRGRSTGWMPSVTLPGVERVEAQPWCRYPDLRVEGATILPPDQVDDRCAPTIWLRATYPAAGPESDLEARLRATVALQAPVGVCSSFRMWDRGPKHDPLSVVGCVRWGVLGLVPWGSPADRRDILDAVEPREWVAASVYDRRPGAQALRSNQAGTQRFGCAEGFALVAVSPLRAYAYLRMMAGDEELRPIHYYLSGEPFAVGEQPRVRTHNRRLDWRNTEDCLGFVTEPPRIAPRSSRTADDEQHMDELGIDAFLAAFGCPSLQETRVLGLQLDAADTQLLDGRTNSAARGVGRPLLSFAWAAHVLPEDHAVVARTLCELTVAAILEQWEGRDVPGARPVRPFASLTGVGSWALTDPDTGEPMRAAAPYEHATIVVGCAAAAQVLPAGEPRSLALGLVRLLSETLYCWSHKSGAGKVEFPFIVGLRSGEDDGLPLPDAWRVEGTPECDQTRVVGGSWTRWTMPGVLAALSVRGEPRVPPSLVARAAEMLDEYLGNHSAELERFFAIDPQLFGQNLSV